MKLLPLPKKRLTLLQVMQRYGSSTPLLRQRRLLTARPRPLLLQRSSSSWKLLLPLPQQQQQL
jgi:hypothetical protein